MRYGLCASPDKLELAGRLGFDYLECSASSISAYGDGEFEKILGGLKGSPLKVERVNVLFPSHISLLGADTDQKSDQKTIDGYLERTFARVRALGGSLAVFGSGRSRAIPGSSTLRGGYTELIGLTRRIGEIAAGHGITVAIEPLNRAETNCVNSLAEGALLQAAAASDSIGLLADLYHMRRENEPMDAIRAVKSLNHTHIAQSAERRYPLLRTAEIEDFFAALKSIGYDGTMSIEGGTDDMEHDAAQALELLRSLG